MKVLLVLNDGMRPDAIERHRVINKLKKGGTYCMDARTVMPSVTLPCHMSLFHSVDPSRHGTTTNTYTPQMRPVSGLFEQLAQAGKKCAMYYSWEELRDITRPGNLARSVYVAGDKYMYESATKEVFETARTQLKHLNIDFAFLYLGWTDEAGHEYGWMSTEYMRAIDESCNMLDELIDEFGEEYTVIFTADHGGHARMHGLDIPEDITIPIFFYGSPFEKGKELHNLSIMDIAPTIAALMGIETPKEWEGKVLV